MFCFNDSKYSWFYNFTGQNNSRWVLTTLLKANKPWFCNHKPLISRPDQLTMINPIIRLLAYWMLAFFRKWSKKKLFLMGGFEACRTGLSQALLLVNLVLSLTKHTGRRWSVEARFRVGGHQTRRFSSSNSTVICINKNKIIIITSLIS